MAGAQDEGVEASIAAAAGDGEEVAALNPDLDLALDLALAPCPALGVDDQIDPHCFEGDGDQSWVEDHEDEVGGRSHSWGVGMAGRVASYPLSAQTWWLRDLADA